MSQFAIEILVRNTTTGNMEWQQLRPSARTARPYRYPTLGKATRVMEVCYPHGNARVIEVLHD